MDTTALRVLEGSLSRFMPFGVNHDLHLTDPQTMDAKLGKKR
jgi:hypothetical protein